MRIETFIKFYRQIFFMFEKRGQNWSIEAIVVLMIFMVLLILSFFSLTFLPKGKSEDLVVASEKIDAMLEGDVGLVKDYKVDSEVLNDLNDLDSEELAEFFGVSGDVCISFKTLEGNRIRLDDGDSGLGIKGDDLECGS